MESYLENKSEAYDIPFSPDKGTLYTIVQNWTNYFETDWEKQPALEFFKTKLSSRFGKIWFSDFS